ncbi:hypothetical protein BKA60DRAFT_668350 [Fusarium oxysporum]|uniref:Uncharacterized protein n=1 Tax=Fusarium oxysporum TaxID=5507 RepID=A0A420N3L4_FUSOX|nr:hypothetical protein BKA60DRAFT_668350 [Fusarium oxysporum]RKK74803.1 hypothetical protein BFJ69_g8239 [Fusarium oxysporum]
MDKISSPPTEDPSHDQGSEPLFPVPPSDPPPYNIPSSQAMHYFPKLPGHIANFNHTTGRLLRDMSAPPSPSGYRAPHGAKQTLSQQLVSKAMMLATVQVQHQLQASRAGITGDANERHRQECGARVAGAKRQEAAQQVHEAILAERDNGDGMCILVPGLLQTLVRGAGYD